MVTTQRWRSQDLGALPDDNQRYEIIDGELFVSKQPRIEHQFACQQIGAALQAWSTDHQSGRAVPAPGVIFSEDNDVAPDVVWVSTDRLKAILGADGHLHGTPELVVEVLSPGAKNTARDRRAKLGLHSRSDVDEYWIIDWLLQEVSVYRRDGGSLRLERTVGAGDWLETPLLPGFRIAVAELAWRLPA
ncbi:MAG: Uma2 family endonuclease [Chloroflexota bacterium]